MSKINFILYLAFISCVMKAQLVHNQAYGFGGTGVDNAQATATDSQGNVYVGGYFSNTVDFYPGSPTFTLQSQGADDAYISVFDAFGNFVNAISFSNNLNCKIFGLATDSQDNLYVTGAFTGAVDFDPGSGVTQLVAGAYYDIFIVKLNSSQVLQWAHRIGHTSYDDYGHSITCDNNDNVLVTGYFQGTNVDFDPASISQYTLSSQSGKDIYVLKLNSSGAFQWAIDIGGTGSFLSDEGNVVKTDANNNVFVGGYFGGTIDFDPGPSTQTIMPSGNIDAFVAKYSSTGSYQWAKNFSGPGSEVTFGLAIDNNNDVYCSGYFTGTVDFDASSVSTALQTALGMEEVFLTKYSSSGNYIWAKSFGGAGSDQSTSLAMSNQKLTIGGFYQGIVDFNPTSSTNTIVSMSGSTDAFISQFDLNGNYLNTYAFGGAASDFLYSVSTNTVGEVFACGNFSLNVDFDSGSNTNAYTSSGNTDAYLLKLSNSTTSVSEWEVFEPKFYPNPVKDKLFVNCEQPVKIVISDVIGNQLILAEKESKNAEVDLQTLGAGVYFVTIITNNNNSKTFKIIKH